MNKTILHLFFIFTFASMYSSEAIDLKESFKGREWEFMQYKLRTAPNNYQFFKKHKKRLGVLLASPTIILSVMTWFGPREVETEERAVVTMITGAIGFFIGLFIATGIELFTKEINKENILLKFIKKWPKNKEYTPIHFHDSCEQLYLLYMQKGETPEFKEHIRKFKVVIEQSLDNRFPKEYYSFTTRTPATTKQSPFMFYKPATRWQPTYNNPAMKTWY